MVRMWQARVWLMWSSIDARVVDLPQPVGPVTRMSPWGSCVRRSVTGGSPRSWEDGISNGVARTPSPQDPPWEKAVGRDRARLRPVKEEADFLSAWDPA